VHDSDAVILRQVRSGQQRLYAVIVDRYKDRALTLAVRLLGDRHEAEDAVQEAFVRAYRHLDRFRGDAQFGTWFYRILTNVCLTLRSRAKNRREIVRGEEGPDPGGMADIPDEDAGALESMEAEEQKRIVGEELARLPEQYRLALTLFYVQEMTYDEIAAVLDLPVGTVKTNLFRGRTQLRRQVQSRIQEEPHQ
jgi:RNA polymerase sigma-70 factor (ECF subfamily)